jgi:hypothetical protein
VAARKVFCYLLCCAIAAKTFVIEYRMKSPVVFGDVEGAYAVLKKKSLRTLVSARSNENCAELFGI